MMVRLLPRPLLLVPAALLMSCGAPKEKEPDTVEAQEAAPLPVQVANLEEAPFTDSVTLFGRIDAEQRVRITAETPGRIEGLPFSEGQGVGRHQTVARINARLAKAQVDQAVASAELAEATLARTKALHDKKLAAGADLEVARAQAAQAKAALEIARANLDKAVIRSPIEGQVTNVMAKVGELASPGVPLLEVVAVNRVVVKADVPERDVALLEVGSPVQVEVEAYPGRPFEGTIREIGLVASAATRTFPIEAALDNSARQLRPGMLARVTLVRQRFENVVVVPRDAVLDELDGKSVYVVQGEVARRQRIELGPARGPYVVVSEGLKKGAQLVVLGHRQVVDGQKVEVTKAFSCCRPTSDATPEVPAQTGKASQAAVAPQKG